MVRCLLLPPEGEVEGPLQALGPQGTSDALWALGVLGGPLWWQKEMQLLLQVHTFFLGFYGLGF